MLVERRARDGIFDGSVTVLVRRWRRPQAVAGRTYRTAAGLVAVDAVTAVDGFTAEDATAAGYGSVAELIDDLRGTPGDPVYLLRVRPADAPDPRAALAEDADLTAEDVRTIDRRLERLDGDRPWTMATLAAIEAEPGRRAGDLAEAAGRERLAFKADVRKLKALGLTISLPVGYRLSPRGETYISTSSRAHIPTTPADAPD